MKIDKINFTIEKAGIYTYLSFKFKEYEICIEPLLNIGKKRKCHLALYKNGELYKPKLLLETSLNNFLINYKFRYRVTIEDIIKSL